MKKLNINIPLILIVTLGSLFLLEFVHSIFDYVDFIDLTNQAAEEMVVNGVSSC